MSTLLRGIAVVAMLVAVGLSIFVFFNLPSSDRTAVDLPSTELRTLSYESQVYTQMDRYTVDSLAQTMNLNLPPGALQVNPQGGPSRAVLLLRIKQIEEDLEEHTQQVKSRVSEIEKNLRSEISDLRDAQNQRQKLWAKLLGILGSVLTALISEWASNLFS